MGAGSLDSETGRSRPLRVHLAALGHPILGDRSYAHALHLLVRHPFRDETVALEAPSPLGAVAPG